MPTPNAWIYIPEVATLLQVRYAKARDAVLSGRCGPVAADGRGRLRVARSAVLAYAKARAPHRAAQPRTGGVE